jgi:hypothetical protein
VTQVANPKRSGRQEKQMKKKDLKLVQIVEGMSI